MNDLEAQETGARAHERYMRIGITVACGLVAAGVIAIAILVSTLFQFLDRQEALAVALDTSREQVESLGAEPVVPPSDVVIEDPSVVTDVASEPVDPAALEEAARVVLVGMLPRAVSDQMGDAVSTYVAGCVASGDCVGPQGTAGTDGAPGEPGPAGEPGAEPTPTEVATAVLTVCHSELDCEATADDVAQAVTDYCAQPSEPCGARWTESEIYKVANRATLDYLSGRPIWCPAEDEVPNDQPFGPCYVSSG